MKKNSSFYFLVSSILSLVILNSVFKKQNIKQIKNNVSLDQYRNRLKEFFVQDQIDDQMKYLCDFMSNGFCAENAFRMVIQEAEAEGV
jgi:hypothetical protein